MFNKPKLPVIVPKLLTIAKAEIGKKEHKQSIHTLFLSFMLLLCFFFLSSCSQEPELPTIPMPVVIAVAPFNQPIYNEQLLAGYLPKEQGEVSAGRMLEYDELLKEKLKETNRQYIFLTQKDLEMNVQLDSKGRENVLSTWAKIAQNVDADFIIVPQILDFAERQGDASYVRVPALLITDIYLIEALDPETGSTDGSLRTRSRYRESSVILPNMSNKGDDYVSPRQKQPVEVFMKEAIQKAIRDFHL